MRKEQDPSRVYARIDPVLGKKMRVAATLLNLSVGDVIEQAVAAWLDRLEIKDAVDQLVASVNQSVKQVRHKQTKAH